MIFQRTSTIQFSLNDHFLRDKSSFCQKKKESRCIWCWLAWRNERWNKIVRSVHRVSIINPILWKSIVAASRPERKLDRRRDRQWSRQILIKRRFIRAAGCKILFIISIEHYTRALFSQQAGETASRENQACERGKCDAPRKHIEMRYGDAIDARGGVAEPIGYSSNDNDDDGDDNQRRDVHVRHVTAAITAMTNDAGRPLNWCCPLIGSCNFYRSVYRLSRDKIIAREARAWCCCAHAKWFVRRWTVWQFCEYIRVRWSMRQYHRSFGRIDFANVPASRCSASAHLQLIRVPF